MGKHRKSPQVNWPSSDPFSDSFHDPLHTVVVYIFCAYELEPDGRVMIIGSRLCEQCKGLLYFAHVQDSQCSSV